MFDKNQRYNNVDPLEVADGVFHLGVQDEKNTFNNVPYMIVDGDEAVFIDPGSAKKEFYDVVLTKAKKVIDLKKITHLIVQHQDPDLCAALPLFEPLVSPNCTISAPLEATVLVQHYGLQSDVAALEDGDTLEFGNGRTLVFAMTPYCHFVGSMVTYDVQTKTVFSSDAFGGFTPDNLLWADNGNYPEQLSLFLGEYLGSKRALNYAVKRLELLNADSGIELICPQHGCVIPKELIPVYLNAAKDLQVGQQIDTLAKKHGITLTDIN
ncbi:MAG: hypothetical protein GY816_14310 [Cytophagales bacterium]|nr:hypothetical protein [Cytophagales bacterium]